MSLPRRWFFALLCGVLACGDRSSSPPRSLEVRAPETVSTGGLAAVEVRVLRGDGSAVEGLPVRFEVLRGGGDVVPPEVSTDGNGFARTMLRAGPAPVRNGLRISAPGADSTAVELLATPSGLESPRVFATLQAASSILAIHAEDIAFDGGAFLYFGTPGGIGRVDAQGREESFANGEGLERVAGIAVDRRGRIYGADGGADVLSRVDPDGSVTVLADEIDGVPFDGPNFTALDSRGNVYLSDPCADSIYRVTPTGAVTRWLDVPGANGFAFTASEDALWIVTEGKAFLCDFSIGPEAAEPVGDLLRVPLRGGEPTGPVEIVEADVGAFGDGIAFDVEGNLYTIFDRIEADFLVGIPLSLQIISEMWVRTPQGEFQRWFASDQIIWANAAFGEGDFPSTTLYLSEFLPGNRIFEIETGIEGLSLIP